MHRPQRASQLGVWLVAIGTLIHPGTVLAQQGGSSGGAEGVPARIATALTAYRAPARAASVDHGAAAALRDVYAQRANVPLWSHEGHATAQAQAVVRILQHAAGYGLEPEDYAGNAIAKLADKQPPSAKADAERLGRFDVQLSGATLRFMSDLHYGRVNPASAGFNLQGMHQPLDLVASLTALASANDVNQTLAAIEPPFHHYALLKNALAKYLDLTQHPELKQLPPISGSLKTGDPYAGAMALRRLLSALGDMPGSGAAPAEPVRVPHDGGPRRRHPADGCHRRQDLPAHADARVRVGHALPGIQAVLGRAIEHPAQRDAAEDTRQPRVSGRAAAADRERSGR
jgi:murein L,D-transpeptidase YcbB/YkuD